MIQRWTIIAIWFHNCILGYIHQLYYVENLKSTIEIARCRFTSFQVIAGRCCANQRHLGGE